MTQNQDVAKLEKIRRKLASGLELTALEEKQFEKLRRDYGATERGTVPTQAALAGALHVSRQTVHRWIHEEGMPVEADGSYDPDKVLAWRRGGSTPDDAESEPEQMQIDKNYWEGRYRKARAEIAEVSLAKEAGSLIPRKEVESLLIDRAIEFKKALLGLGRRVSLRGEMKPAKALHAIIDEACLDILATYSRENIVIGAPEVETPKAKKKAKKKIIRRRKRGKAK